MKVDLTHLARPIQHREPNIKLLDPLYRALTRYMQRAGLMQMVTYPYLGGVSGNTTNYGPTYSPVGISVAEVELDFAAIATARTAAGQAALAANDVLTLFGVRAGTLVHAVSLDVTTAEGAVATCQLGDGADPNGFLAAADLNAVAHTASLLTTPYSVAVGGGKLYTADDTIDMTLDHNSIDVAVCRVTVVSFDLRSSR